MTHDEIRQLKQGTPSRLKEKILHARGRLEPGTLVFKWIKGVRKYGIRYDRDGVECFFYLASSYEKIENKKDL